MSRQDDESRCEEELEQVKEENELLRKAAGAFGALAERLSGELEAERRNNREDRRRASRKAPDRRRTRSD